MDIQAFFCLDGQQRGDLMDLMGAGVPVYFFDSLPHDARFPVGIIVTFEPQDMGPDQTIQLTLRTPAGAPFSEGTLTVNTSKMAPPPGARPMLSTVGWLAGRVPERGVYTLDVSVAGQVLRRTSVLMDLMPPTQT